MVEGPDPTSRNLPHSQIQGPKPSKLTPSSHNELPVGKMHHVLGMNMTEDQYKKFISQLLNSVIRSIKHNEARMKKAMQKMKDSFEGKPS